MGKPKMLNILKTVIVERNGRKFGTRGTTVHICAVLFMPNCFSLVWDHSVHICKFSDSTIFETLLLQQFSSDFNYT